MVRDIRDINYYGTRSTRVKLAYFCIKSGAASDDADLSGLSDYNHTGPMRRVLHDTHCDTCVHFMHEATFNEPRLA